MNTLSLSTPDLAQAAPWGLDPWEYARVVYTHHLVGDLTAVRVHLEYTEVEGAGIMRHSLALPLWDADGAQVDVLKQAGLMMASSGVVLIDEWVWWPEASAAWARIGHRAPLDYGPELLERTADNLTNIALVASAVHRRGLIDASPMLQQADASLEGFYRWVQLQVEAHGWPWRTVDGPAVVDAALQAAWIHPDPVFRVRCRALVQERVLAGDEPQSSLERLAILTRV
jgi:hypothetical protein